ncbi:FTR1 family protein [Rhodanobacter sp. FW102-FHT14D06]|jgi:high-affinity iron transporter|uniref:FTR1 family protein n=2 Tax=unclassified Rhodanobacter TaxID=2621553 RepID=A0AB74UYK5_9GAMM
MITTLIRRILRKLSVAALLLCSVTTFTVVAQDAIATVPQTWQILDYLATDYAGAVKDGAVISASEYAEMREFTSTTRSRIDALPPTATTPALMKQADTLVASVDAKAAPAQVATQAHALADALLQAYPVPTAPEHAPDLARGATLYQNRCAACHGATGHGDGPAGLQLSPHPVNFTDQTRADQRSALSLYEVISQGVEGTPMASYAQQLSSDDRWALAYYVGSLAYTQESATGADTWQHDTAARAQIADLKELSRVRVAQLTPTLGAERARAIVGYLRAHPDVIHQQALAGIPLARARLAASLTAYRAGAKTQATQLALSAYLDGVEPVEPQLNARDGALRAQLETAMGAYRTALTSSTSVASVAKQSDEVDGLLLRAQEVTSDAAGDAAATFLGAFTILVREGLEALLVVVALLAFLRKAARPEARRYVHAGWSLALVAGGVTWAIASYAISISGAGRELTEGLSSLFAAFVLLGVGLWMHQKSIGGRWQAYLKEKMAAALNRRSAWFLFGLAFISVYREVFESILFYAALWNDGQEVWLLGGIAAGAAALGLIAWVLLRTSHRLPIGTFFSASSVLIAVLAVVLTGKGVAALQEAGWVAVSVAPVPHIELLGIYPTWQSLLAQLAILVLLAVGFVFNIRRGRQPLPSPQGAQEVVPDAK